MIYIYVAYIVYICLSVVYRWNCCWLVSTNIRNRHFQFDSEKGGKDDNRIGATTTSDVFAKRVCATCLHVTIEEVASASHQHVGDVTIGDSFFSAGIQQWNGGWQNRDCG